MARSTFLFRLFVGLWALPVFAAPDTPTPVVREWNVEGVTRRALICVPESAKSADAPLVFAFHGHGGTMEFAARNFGFHKLWPEAIVVYMQGLPTPGITDREGKLPGWQRVPGDQKDRDLKFFDQVLADLRKEYKVDAKRIYVTGHSNGGLFTYVLWAARGDLFAAVAPSAAICLSGAKSLKPKAALLLAGEKDELVPFAMQKRMMESVRQLNGCPPESQPWGGVGAVSGVMYPSTTHTPFVSLTCPGTHRFPPEAPTLIIKFFQENPLP